MIKDKRPYFLELTTFILLMCVSATYHFYDNSYSDRKIFWELYRWDRILAFQAVGSCMMHIVDIRNLFIKFIYWSLNLIILVITQYRYEPYGNNFLGLGLVVGFNLSVLVVKYKLFTKKGLYVFFEHNDIIDIIVTFVNITVGIIFFVLSNTVYQDQYWWMHSLWHVLIFFATWSALDIREVNVSMFCIPRKKYNPISSRSI
jgi:predicted membrane channel-forming protein YqfA (hemolysin III family)